MWFVKTENFQQHEHFLNKTLYLDSTYFVLQ